MHLHQGLGRPAPAGRLAAAGALCAAVAAGTVLSLTASASAAAANQAGAAQIQVKGSDTIGGKLGQDLAHAFTARHPELAVHWEALGSGTAFVGLFDGSAQLGASSRSVKESEIAEARRLGIELREFVIGYDGIAVVVNPENPVTELTVTQLSDLFTGRIRNWREVGGPDLAVHVITRPSYSGTFSFFRDKVLRRGNDRGPEDYAPGAEVIEENGAIVKRVAQERGAVSYLGIGWVTAEVRALGVAPRAGQPAIRASVATIRNGTYPIYRPLLMYSRGEPHGPARGLLAFILSRDGQKLVADNDFVPSDTPVALAEERGGPGAAEAGGTTSGGAATAAAPRMVRVQFPAGAELTESARDSLAALAESVRAGHGRLLVVGHADARGSRAANSAMALARAHAVAHYLTGLGVPADAITIEGHSAEDPVSSNETRGGRKSNRRVDITVLAPAPAP
jgi:phosphate transport system substrate-binding protein